MSLLPGLFARGAPQRGERPVGRYTPPPGVGPLLAAHRRYLGRRGFDPDELAEKYSVGGIGPGGKLQWRLFLPINRQGKPQSWTTRSVGESHLRYISASPKEEETPIHSLLGGEDECRSSCIVTEGVFDMMRIGPGAVCTFGTSYTTAQVLKIAKFPVRVVCFDSDRMAQKKAAKLANELAAFDGVTYNAVLSGKDPCDSPEDEIRELRRRFLE
jgi:hypothetical protein